MKDQTKILDSIWFRETIGIVAKKNSIGEVKFYIGLGKGYNQSYDEERICDQGSKIDADILINFFKNNQNK